jgi:hypothetical protein
MDGGIACASFDHLDLALRKALDARELRHNIPI